MTKSRYILLIVGAVLGLISLHVHTGEMFWAELAVPLGMIGYGVGGLIDGRGERHPPFYG